MSTLDAATALREMRMALPIPMTLEELSKALKREGIDVSAGHLSNVERGVKGAGPKLLAALANVYKCDRQMLRKTIQTTRARYRRSESRRIST